MVRVSILLLAAGLGFGACMPDSRNNHQSNKGEASSLEPGDGFGRIARKPLVDGGALRLASVQLNKIEVGSHNSMEIETVAGDEVDYMEFYACTNSTGDVQCNPSKEAPASFATATHLIPNMPAGPLKIGVRACLEAANALDSKKPCGAWTIHDYYQVPNKDTRLATLLEAIYKKEEEVKGLAKSVLDSFEATLARIPSSAREEGTQAAKLAALLENQLLVGPHAIGELYAGRELSELAFSLQDEIIRGGHSPQDLQGEKQGLALSDDKGDNSADLTKKIGAAILISIGSNAIFDGASDAVYYIRRNKARVIAMQELERLKAGVIPHLEAEARLQAAQISYDKLAGEHALIPASASPSETKALTAEYQAKVATAFKEFQAAKTSFDNVKVDDATIANLETSKLKASKPTPTFNYKRVGGQVAVGIMGVVFGFLFTTDILGLTADAPRNLEADLNTAYNSIRSKKAEILELRQAAVAYVHPQ